MPSDGECSEAGPAWPHPAGRRRRRPDRRTHRVDCSFGDDEYAAMLTAAAAAGLSKGAFCSRAVTAVVSGRAGGKAGHQVLRDALGELVRANSQLRKAGTNYNQAVRALNRTGIAAPELAAYADQCSQAAGRVDAAAEQVRRAALG